MKLRKLLTSLALCLFGIILIGSIPTEAASKKIKLTPSTKKDTYEYVYVDVTSTIKAEEVTKVEYQFGKVKKTADKKWKDASALYFYENDDGSTISWFNAYYNGTYSVRISTKSGKKYVKTIKIKNILPASTNSNKEATITGVSGPDKKGNFTITVDYLTPYNKNYDELVGLKVGDTLDFSGKETTIISMYSLSDNYELVPMSAYDDTCVGIICQVKNWKDFYPEDEWEYRKDPANQVFGLYSFGGLYYAYDDYEYAPDCYVMLGYTYPSQVKLKVNSKTKVYPAYVDREKYPDGCELTAEEYFSLIGNKDLQDQMGIYIYEGINFKIYEKYDKKTGQHTDVVAELHEIYTP